MVVPTLFSDFRLAPFIIWLQSYNKNCTYANKNVFFRKKIEYILLLAIPISIIGYTCTDLD